MKQRTLRSSADFTRVLRTGKRARRDGVTAYVAPLSESTEASRLGLAVRCRRAVDRNLLKRRLRGAWRSYQPGPGFEIAIRADEGALSTNYQELEIHLHEALRAAGVSPTEVP
ncbi:MAG TPA: ribonuclease P protein component [Candidatus Eisenbacteria bacterium]|nr:ribonuclease P protein component [Candidatus Eisenbacteria bacterium]